MSRHYPTLLSQWHLPTLPGCVKRDFLTLHDLTPEEFAGLLDLAAEVKRHPEAFRHALDGKVLALVFEKPSLRTRVSFEVGMEQLGGRAIYLGPADVGLGRRETVADVARNLARWVQAAAVRTFGHSIVEEMAREAPIPIINALSDLLHPSQALADALTLREHKRTLRGLHLAYLGDGNNVCHALLQAAAKTGMHLAVAAPRGYEPRASIFAEAREDARATGAQLLVVEDPVDAVERADAVYTDVWASMGQEAEGPARRAAFSRYQVNRYRMARAKPDALFLHCLPAHRGEEVTSEVLDGPRSIVLEQAENRLHVAKAILLALLGEGHV